MKKNFLLLLCSIILVFVLSLVTDRVIGALGTDKANLVSDNYTLTHWDTPEFTMTARANNLGFRGRDISFKKTAKYRVVLLGDSFTFGWGVKDGETWAELLEANLREDGLDVEVANLGNIGGHSEDFADIAEDAAPLLKPDLIVVGLLQGEDLAQKVQAMRRIMTVTIGGKKEAEGSIIKRLYPNLIELRKGIKLEEKYATAPWGEHVMNILQMVDEEGRARLMKTDQEIQALFMKGELNPVLLYYSISMPGLLQRTLEINDPEIEAAITDVSKDLKRIKESAAGVGGRAMVISLPMGGYVSRENMNNYGRMGLEVSPRLLETALMDEATRISAEKAGLPFFEVTETFRKEAQKKKLYFSYDGHFNVEGNSLFASEISPLVAAELRKIK